MYPVGQHAIDASDLDPLPNLVSKLGKLQDRPSVHKALLDEGIDGKAFLYVKPHLSPRQSDEIGAFVS